MVDLFPTKQEYALGCSGIGPPAQLKLITTKQTGNCFSGTMSMAGPNPASPTGRPKQRTRSLAQHRYAVSSFGPLYNSTGARPLSKPISHLIYCSLTSTKGKANLRHYLPTEYTSVAFIPLVHILPLPFPSVSEHTSAGAMGKKKPQSTEG